ncbi:peptide chain release factor N(5)-glutamine methyltransferase [Parabacteroides gordonii]|jgi:release factor glutamine methyltransferase|uniref:peptide chain release factor N(5)-glutamine methyltransferase n=1 Tax=Parabacteroides gordonii TaxID=574930 RepID=UPI00241D5EA9|nr:peptide chain release factor N(5)-glutamine methyltransferase [Parabacteroides gordonii]
MTETVAYIQNTLKDYYPLSEIKAFTRLIMERVCDIQPHQFLLCKDKELSEKEKSQIHNIVERLTKYEPIQYIFGKTDFYGFEFEVNPSVLIPRPETEELVELIVRDYPKRKELEILDVGTGSGCIAITLKKLLNKSQVYALDVSEEALKTAKRNAIRNRAPITFFQKDILTPSETADSIEEEFDIIVSNPPYIMEKEKVDMEANVLDYEPSLALFVPDDNPLLYYHRITLFAEQKLKKKGYLYFEINSQMGEQVVSMLRMMEFKSIELIQDLSGKDRFVKTQTWNR